MHTLTLRKSRVLRSWVNVGSLPPNTGRQKAENIIDYNTEVNSSLKSHDDSDIIQQVRAYIYWASTMFYINFWQQPQRGRCYFHLCFVDQETEGQRDSIPCPGSCYQQVTKPILTQAVWFLGLCWHSTTHKHNFSLKCKTSKTKTELHPKRLSFWMTLEPMEGIAP